MMERVFSGDMPANLCPACGETIDAATGTDGTGAAPTPGDITVCAYCLAVLYFTEEMKLAAFSEDELTEMYKADPLMAMMIQQAKNLLLAMPPEIRTPKPPEIKQ